MAEFAAVAVAVGVSVGVRGHVSKHSYLSQGFAAVDYIVNACDVCKCGARTGQAQTVQACKCSG